MSPRNHSVTRSGRLFKLHGIRPSQDKRRHLDTVKYHPSLERVLPHQPQRHPHLPPRHYPHSHPHGEALGSHTDKPSPVRFSPIMTRDGAKSKRMVTAKFRN